MENKEAVIRKIESLLALAGNNPNENEAIAAALKAQQLMAKYNVELAEVEGRNANQEITREFYEIKRSSHYVSKWKIELSNIIARNFCCKTYLLGKDIIAFYGYEKDVRIAKEVFRFLFEAGNRMADRYYRKCRKEGRETRGVLNTYLLGFCNGVREVLDRQCTALMLVVPKEVEKAYQEHTKGWKKVSGSLQVSKNKEAYQTGKQEGKDTAQARGIEG